MLFGSLTCRYGSVTRKLRQRSPVSAYFAPVIPWRRRGLYHSGGPQLRLLLRSNTAPIIATFHDTTYNFPAYGQTRYLSTGPSKDENSDANSNDNKDKPDMWTQIQSTPNLITLGRMASTPLLCYWIASEHYTLAITGCILASISDGLDGYIAKHHGGSTVLGTYLDPIADKVLINGLAVSLWYVGILPTPLTALWATKDILLLSGTAWYLHQQNQTINILSNSIATKPLTVTPTLLGKANTGLQFATLWIGILTPVVEFPEVLLPSLCWITGFTTVGSVLSYQGGAGIKMFRENGTKAAENDGDEKSNSDGKK